MFVVMVMNDFWGNYCVIMLTCVMFLIAIMQHVLLCWFLSLCIASYSAFVFLSDYCVVMVMNKLCLVVMVMNKLITLGCVQFLHDC